MPSRPSSRPSAARQVHARPENPITARQWIREAIGNGNYDHASHFEDRLRERGLSVRDALHALEKSKLVEAYPRIPDHGGSCWRVWGRDVANKQDVVVGVEAYIDSEGRMVILCTLFAVEVKR